MAGSGRGAWIAHTVLLAGLALVLFPIYVAFVASSLTLRDVLDAPMTLIPGPQLFANYREALATGTMQTSGQGGSHDDGEQPGHGPRHCYWQDRDLSALGLCRRVFSVSAAPAVFLGDLCD